MDDLYRNPGPIQFAGPGADLITTTLVVEDNDYIGKVQELYAYLKKVNQFVVSYRLYSLESGGARDDSRCFDFSLFLLPDLLE